MRILEIPVVQAALGIIAVSAVAYGLVESGLISMSTPEQRAERAAAQAEREAERAAARLAAQTDKRRSDNCTNGSISARLTARDAVRRNLISPRSASFSDERVAHLGDCQLEATGFVYAQNAFGAEIRSVYIVSLQYHPERDTWDTLDVMIQ